MPYVGITDIMVKSLKGKIKLEAAGIMSCPTEFQVLQSTFRTLKDNEIRMPLLQTTARSQFGRHLIASTGSFLFDQEIPLLIPDTISEREHRVSFTRDIQQGSSCNFAWAGAVCSTQDFNDPQSESERMIIFLLRDNKVAAIRKHTQLWADLWEEGDIEVEGDPVAQQDIRLALYHLYSFSRTDSDLSIPPMGFSSRIYNGHIFWDTELWMFPPLLVFNQDIAKSLLNYRFNRLQKARQKAVSYGYAGAMFPWESDDTGEEATPSWALTGTFEHHITADIGIAFWNFYSVTHDKNWLRQTGFPVLKEIADFWVSRAEKNPDGSWSIKNVVGANEFAPNVDDNAFTNGSAKAVLEYAGKAAGVLGVTSDLLWLEVAKNLKFNYLENGVMMEHSRYQGEIIKQADVNLLAYPLGIVNDPLKVRKDLEYYAPRISAEGPAMGYSILSILYSRLGDEKMAFELFKKSYEPNKRAPFGSLAEAAQFNNTYFATGAGGMLQAVIFGFAGLNITDEGIVRYKSCLPEHWKKLTIKGIGIKNETITITGH
jgi:trehalose/maltose hydrolase-like predicted phosphorylase